MELCFCDLKTIIEQKSECSGRGPDQAMDVFEYFISCQIFKDIVEGLQYLHKSEIIHRDLNPKNILISEKPRNGKFIRICDFGLAKDQGPETKTSLHCVGTPGWMAPEIPRYSQKSDIYSLAYIA